MLDTAQLPPQQGADTTAEERLNASFTTHLRYTAGVFQGKPDPAHAFQALACAVREHLLDKLHEGQGAPASDRCRSVHLISMEYIIGRLLETNLINLDLRDAAARTLAKVGVDLADVVGEEPDLCLGNGGMARWSSCLMDAVSSANIPACGYGLDYEFGLFRQRISNGYQLEEPERSPLDGAPWRITGASDEILVPVFGQTKRLSGASGNSNVVWLDWDVVMGVPSDIPVCGLDGETVNRLRLYTARSSPEFNRRIAAHEHYLKAIDDRIASEKISKILYPQVSDGSGRQLRLIQQYFLVSCAVQDITRQHVRDHGTVETLAQHQAIQLNGFKTALTIVELMRVLIDEFGLGWDRAWRITHKTCSATCHSLTRNALESWPIGLIEKVLPRHAGILRRLEKTFAGYIARKAPEAGNARPEMMLSRRDGPDNAEQVDPANLCLIGCHSVNAVSKAHGDILMRRVAPGFARLWPGKIGSITNGVSQRRWIALANPSLSAFLDKTIGAGWRRDLSVLAELEDMIGDAELLEHFRAAKHANKKLLAGHISRTMGLDISGDALFDVHAKQIHENRRQLLTLLYVIDRYLAIKEDGECPAGQRAFIFSGKAIPGDAMAGLIIKLINGLAALINNDPHVEGALQVVFIPDFKVSVAEQLAAAADVSEQLTTPGHEACGTGAMKNAMNGARVLGSRGGGNLEIFEAAGEGTMYPFGGLPEDVLKSQSDGSYDVWHVLECSPAAKRAVDTLTSGLICPREEGVFDPIRRALIEGGDHYQVVRDFGPYAAAQARIEADYQAPIDWAEKSLLGVARMGHFSADRAVREYVNKMWAPPGDGAGTSDEKESAGAADVCS